MILTRHVLYDNWKYYQLDTEELRTLLISQELVIDFIKKLGVTGKLVDEVYYKRECILFELHRRSFQNCMIQMYSVCKVKFWLPTVKPSKRCKCCHMEYYEFSDELSKVEQGTLKCSRTISNLLATDAFDDGRALGFIRNDSSQVEPSTLLSWEKNTISPTSVPDSYSYIDEGSVMIPIPSPRMSKNVTFAPMSISSNSSLFSPSYVNDEERRAPIPAPRLSKMAAAFPSSSSSSSSHPGILTSASRSISSSDYHIYQPVANQRTDSLTLRSILKRPKSDSMPSTSADDRSNEQSGTELPKTRKRYVTFNLHDDAKHPIQYNYQRGNDDGAGASTVDRSARYNRPVGRSKSLIGCFTRKLFK